MAIQAIEPGVFAIPWAHTELDHQVDAPPSFLANGASWRWWGEARRLDGPSSVLRLVGADGEDQRRDRARRRLMRWHGPSIAASPDPASFAEAAGGADFLLTDGRAVYPAKLIEPGPAARLRLVLFPEGLPPRGGEFWVLGIAPDLIVPERAHHVMRGEAICFTPGTRIAVPGGTRAVETLRAGDMVMTRDDGAQPLIWVGGASIDAARLRARPGLRPVRLRAVGQGQRDLVVSPAHRILWRMPAARGICGADEVLVAARDLIDDRRVIRDHRPGGVDYLHLMFERHQVIDAEGVAVESFHPGQAALGLLPPEQRAQLVRLLPGLAAGQPGVYGAPARRFLTTAEAEILRHASLHGPACRAA